MNDLQSDPNGLKSKRPPIIWRPSIYLVMALGFEPRTACLEDGKF